MTLYSERETIRRDDRADLREAYERGRRDARTARRRHPLLMSLTAIAALVGAVVLALAIANGSFRDAGAVVDQNLATAADQAGPAMSQAASQAGQAVRDATSKDGTEAPASR